MTSRIITNVATIDIDVLTKHKVGDVLDVEIQEQEVLALVDGDGEILGYVLHTDTSDVIECIKQGHKYEAEITSINSPACKVLIKRK